MCYTSYHWWICWVRYYVWPPCWDVLQHHVGCCWLEFGNGQIWANNTQHVATRWPNATCCVLLRWDVVIVWSRLNVRKPRPNDRNKSTQYIATLLGATCWVRLASMLRRVAACCDWCFWRTIAASNFTVAGAGEWSLNYVRYLGEKNHGGRKFSEIKV